ncbi:hypothetical protein ACFQ4K_06055 [Tistrella bauzanensis]
MTYGQGWLFARAMEAETFGAYVDGRMAVAGPPLAAGAPEQPACRFRQQPAMPAPFDLPLAQHACFSPKEHFFIQNVVTLASFILS